MSCCGLPYPNRFATCLIDWYLNEQKVEAQLLEFAATRRLGLIEDKVDLGQLFEALLYYDRVHLIVDAVLFSNLWAQLGPKLLRTLMHFPGLTVDLVPDFAVIHSEERFGLAYHKPVFARMAGRKEKPISHSDIVGILRQHVSGKPGIDAPSRKDIQAVIKDLRVADYLSILTDERRDYGARFESLACDSSTLASAIISYAVGRGLTVRTDLLSKAELGSILTSDGLMTHSSVPLKEIVPTESGSPVTWGQVLAHLNDYGMELQLSIRYSADIIGPPAMAGIAEARIDESLNRAAKSSQRIEAFERFAFDEAPFFGGAINDGRLSIDDALRIVDQSRKFRQWVRGLPPDSDLVKEYLRALSKDTKLGTLPGSALRFSFFQTTEAVVSAIGGPLLGKAVSAFDTFLVDRLAKGWRPNIFVKHLKESVPERE